MDPVRILFLMDYYFGTEGGTEGQVAEIIKNLDKRRFEPRLVLFQETAYLKDHPFPCESKVLNITKLLSFKTVRALLRFSRDIRNSKIDLVHIFLNDASIVAPFFCKMGGAKVLSSRRDMGFWYTGHKIAALKLSNRFVDCIIANSEAVKKNVSKMERLSDNRIVVIHNGQDGKRFMVPPANDFRIRHGIGLNDPIIGMVSNLYSLKRPQDLIRAFGIVLERYESAHLVFLGGGELEINPLRKLVEDLNIDRRVHFLGRVGEVVPIIMHFTACVLCSETEGLSNAIIEYLGCSKPIVCTNVGGNPELVVDGYNGFLVEVGDVRNLSDRIMRILADPSLARELGENARTTFSHQFPTQKMVTAYMNLYEELVRRGGNTQSSFD